MHRGGVDFGGSKVVPDADVDASAPSRLRRLHKDKHHRDVDPREHFEEEEAGEGGGDEGGRGGRARRGGGGGGGGGRFDLSRLLIEDPSPSSLDQPGSASSLRRQVVASLMQQQRRAIESNPRAIQPLSPASFGSSMELTPYNPAVTPASSLDFGGRVRHNQHFSLKTSTELLKVLNRIWSLEEQHASSVSLIRALKMERDHARAQIKELLRDQQADRREIDVLMKQISEDKVVRKTKEQDRLHAAVQSVREELEDERKLRKRSEGLHRKLAREVSDVKTALTDALKEAERERRSRKLLEDLCDEFAVGIREYEQEVHSLKQKSDREWDRNTDRMRLILHISESWLDERMQMKVEEAQHGQPERLSIVEKLSFEIETFLKAKRMSALDSTSSKLQRERPRSLESVPLNEAVSAPQAVFDDEGSSAGSDSNCFELKRNENGFKVYEDEARDDDDGIREVAKDLLRKKAPPRRKKKGMNLSVPAANSEKVVPLKKEKLDRDPTEVGVTTHDSEVHDRNESSVIDDFVKGQLIPGGVHLHANVDSRQACGSSSSAWRTQASPVRQWTSRLKSTDPESETLESASRLPSLNSRENTLKSKLMEARSKGQQRSWRSKVTGRFS
ncbi:hypothetical protein MLD38_018661 [Melastoma candidum]|uniref:Uncharacterized protein n=1 Tax=Melastoma candidum TaxID=119954 RepID=A0ACB9QY01_9MYRT|nr:hypothetical protein MLD38_018661 [Melastoma candidum]